MPLRRLLPLVPAVAAMAAALAVIGFWPSAHPAAALPPAGDDTMNVQADAYVWTRLGTENLTLLGTATVHRSDPHIDGGVQVVDTELVDLNLTGNSSTGPVTLRGNGLHDSLGEIRALQPGNEFPASSFFDTYIQVIAPGSPIGTVILHNEIPIHVTPRDDQGEAPINAWPPLGAKYQMTPIYQVDNDGDTQIDEDTADDDGDGFYDEDRPGTDPDTPGSGSECGTNPDCDFVEGEDPAVLDTRPPLPANVCPAAQNGTPTLCDDDGDGQIDEDPSCIPLMNVGNTHLPMGVCVRTVSFQVVEAFTPTPTRTPCPPASCTPTPTLGPGTPTPTRTRTPAPPTPTRTPGPGNEEPSMSLAPGGPSGVHPADIMGLRTGPLQVAGNDNFNQAFQIGALPFSAEQDTTGATKELDEPDNPGGCITFSPARKGATVWYKFTAPAAFSLTADTFGSDYDTVIAVYTGSAVDSLTLVQCNDDTNNLQSQIVFDTTAGATYYIQAGGFDDRAGSLHLNVTGSGGAGTEGQPRIPCARLGLTGDGCDDGADGDQDDLDALSYGADFGGRNISIAFSVAPGSLGLDGTGVLQQTTCTPAQPQADEFSSTRTGTNVLAFDGDGLAGGGCPTGPGLGLIETPSSDDLDALADQPPAFVDPDGEGTPDQPVFFSLAAGSPSLAAFGRQPGDIFWTVGGFQPGVYAPATSLGLLPADDVDGLCIKDAGDGSPTYNPSVDMLLFSLAPGSPSLAAIGASPGDVLGPGPQIVYTAASLGLRGADDLDAVNCYTPQGPQPTPTPAGAVGDANCDGRVNSLDAALVLQREAGLINSLRCASLADADQNGRINSIDATLILQYNAGLITHLP